MSKICTNCNAENIDEAKFCRKCGSTISKVVKDDIINKEEQLKHVEIIESEWDRKYAKLQQEVREDRKRIEDEKQDINTTYIPNDEDVVKKTYTKLDVFFYPNNYTEEEKKEILGDEYEET